MRRIACKLGAALVLSLFTSACTTHVGSFTMISHKDVDLSRQHAKTQDAVAGKDTLYIIVVFPTGRFPSLVVGAVTDAIESNGIDYLKDADIENTFWYIPLIFGISTTTIKGEGWKVVP